MVNELLMNFSHRTKVDAHCNSSRAKFTAHHWGALRKPDRSITIPEPFSAPTRLWAGKTPGDPRAWSDSPQFALGRKVPLGDALIVAAHKRRGSDPGQGKKFLRCFELTTVAAVRINHDSPPLADISTAPAARKGAVCEEANFPGCCAPQATLLHQRHRPTGRPAVAKMVWSPVLVSHDRCSKRAYPVSAGTHYM
jgi:hypothetical protein